jgi:hypothetical protein
MQELCTFIKRSNLQIMSSKEVKEVQDKCIRIVFNKITAKKQIPNLKKETPIQV